MRDTGKIDLISITPVRLFIRFDVEDAFYEDWWVPTDELAEAVTLATELGLEFEVQPERMAPETHACDAPVEKFFRQFAERLHDPARFAGMKADFYRFKAGRAA